MSLSPCKECGEKISSKAKECPHCGHPVKKSSSAGGCFLLIALGIVGFVVLSQIGGDAEPKDPRQALVESAFSQWDGSHRYLERRIKSGMNDPSSYEHVETRFADKGTYVLVITQFRGKNAFGGMVTNTVTARCSVSGEVLEILSD